MTLLLAILILLCSLPMTASALKSHSPANRQSLLVMDVKTIGLPDDFSTTLTEQLTSTIHQIGKYNVTSSVDISRQLELEKDKDLFGCDDISCQTELAGALGADLIVTATVTKAPHEAYYFLALVLKDNLGNAQNRISASVGGKLHDVMQEMDYYIYKLFKERPPKNAKNAVNKDRANIEKNSTKAPQKSHISKPKDSAYYRKASKYTMILGLSGTATGLALLVIGGGEINQLAEKQPITQVTYTNNYKLGRNFLIAGGTVTAVSFATLFTSLALLRKSNQAPHYPRFGAAFTKDSTLLTFSGEFQ